MSGKKISDFGQKFSDFGHEVSERGLAWLESRYPAKAAESIASDLRVPVSTARKWVSHLAPMSRGAFATAIIVHGPEFLCAALGPSAPAWLDEDARDAQRAALQSEIAEIEKRMADIDRA
jgi:hypothetical protein